MREPTELSPMDPEELLARLGTTPRVLQRGWLITGGVVVLLAIGAWLVFTRGPGGDAPTGPEAVADEFLAAWTDEDGAAMATLFDDQVDQADAIFKLGLFDQVLDIRSATATRSGAGTTRTNALDLPVEVELRMAGMAPWRYDTTLTITNPESDEPRVLFSESFLHPEWNETTSLRRSPARWEDRAQVLGNGDVPIYDDRPAVIVSMIPERVTDIDELANGLARYVPVTADEVRALFEKDPASSAIVPIVDMEDSSYKRVLDNIRPLPGAVFEPGINLDEYYARLPVASPFAETTLGRVGTVGSRQLLSLGLPYTAESQVGLTGVERAKERQLAGRPGQAVELLDAEGVTLKVLFNSPPVPPEPVRITLDESIQLAAEQALTGIEHPAALVAVDGRNGEIRAVATRPSDGERRALSGVRSPGNAFSLVVGMALLEKGVGIDAAAQCPDRLNINDVTITNEDGRVPSRGTFGDAIVRSCTTALVDLAEEELSADEIRDTANALGIGVPTDLGVPSDTGNLAEDPDDSQFVLQLAGQSGVGVTPLEIAAAAAAIATDTHHPTILFRGEPAPDAAPGASTLPLAEPSSFSQASAMRDLMRLVVDEGTGSAAGIEGFDVGGVTGTEVGDDGPIAGWFAGFSEDLGFAIVVDAPARGGEIAAPIAGDFVRTLREARQS